MPDANEPDPSHPTLRDYWIAEILRLRETRMGPFEDSAALRHARQAGGTFPQRLVHRARYLGRKEGLDDILAHWQGLARVAGVLLFIMAVFAGAGTAAGALGDGSRPVNIVLAIVALLGLPTLMLMLWLGSAFLSPGQASSLGRAWLWISNKLDRGPNAALAPRALLELAQQRRCTRAISGVVSHSLWLAALLSAVVALLALLSARRYSFNWETTLLSPDTFVLLTHALGWLPGLLGFQMPPDALVRASDGLQALPDHVHALWSSWLIGCVVVYGLLPRALLLALNASIAVQRSRQGGIDPTLPGFAELHDRLMPASTPAGIDAPAPPLPQPQTHGQAQAAAASHAAAVLGLELAPDTCWPVTDLAGHIHNLGTIDSRAQRHALLDTLHAAPPARLLVVCDAAQTPDRGTLAFISELATPVPDTHVLLMAEPTRPGKPHVWKQALLAAGFAAGQIHTHTHDAQAWLDKAGPGEHRSTA
jgi:hypothetical protein